MSDHRPCLAALALLLSSSAVAQEAVVLTRASTLADATDDALLASWGVVRVERVTRARADLGVWLGDSFVGDLEAAAVTDGKSAYDVVAMPRRKKARRSTDPGGLV
ncbi:MAG: hypothetical protein H6732_14680, partial [Alphaproteobacteria bacterium]|nr:hypothetical protein [Alphaproteobacteria bacterium]